VSKALEDRARQVQEALRAQGFEVVVLAEPARRAADAARALGCAVDRIAKSLVFRTRPGGRPVLVVASGANRVNEVRIGMYLKEAVEQAPAPFVHAVTGFVVGGVPPIGHRTPLETFVDEDLLRHAEVWAAAGTPHALVRLPATELVRLTGGRVVRVT